MKQFFILVCSVIFTVTAVVGCTLSTNPVSISRLPETESLEGDHIHEQDNTARITLAEAKKDFDAGNAVFVDTRGDISYKAEHIKGAVNVPFGDFNAQYKNLPKDKKIIAYCSCPNEETSSAFVKKLKQKRINNAFALIGGTSAWKDAGYPMDKK